jgi:DNA-binding NtrC family response regulator
MKNDKNKAKKELILFSTATQINPVRHVLIVDDDNDTRQLSIDVLTNAGFAVDFAINGAAAWEAVKIKHYDLLLTDNQMPKMTGIELIAKIRRTRVGLPIIMVTSHLPINIFNSKPWLKPDAALQRPISNDQLVKAARNVLRTDDTYNAHIALLLPKYI